MKKAFLLLLVNFITTICFAQDITGEWYTIDDNTKEKKAIVEIYAEGDAYFGKIKTSLVSDNTELCTECDGSKKNKPIKGLVIIEKMKLDGDEYNGGTILDPESGTEYKCLLQLESKDKLKVRGYVGFSLLGRTQYWQRKQ